MTLTPRLSPASAPREFTHFQASLCTSPPPGPPKGTQLSPSCCTCPSKRRFTGTSTFLTPLVRRWMLLHLLNGSTTSQGRPTCARRNPPSWGSLLTSSAPPPRLLHSAAIPDSALSPHSVSLLPTLPLRTEDSLIGCSPLVSTLFRRSNCSPVLTLLSEIQTVPPLSGLPTLFPSHFSTTLSPSS